MKDDADDDVFKSLHQLVSCLSEKPKPVESRPDLKRRDSSDNGLAFTPSLSSSSENSSSNKTLLPSFVLLENFIEDVCILDIRVILEEYGEVLDVYLVPGSAGKASAYASFACEEEAEYATESLNGVEADGRLLACRLTDALASLPQPSSDSELQGGTEKTMLVSRSQAEEGIQERDEKVEVEILLPKAEEQIQDPTDKERSGEAGSLEVADTPKPKLVEWALQPEAEPAGLIKDATLGQQKIPVHESDRMPRSSRRVAVEATTSLQLSDFPGRQMPPHTFISAHEVPQHHSPHQRLPFLPAGAPMPSKAWSAYETMYAGGSTSPTSVINGTPQVPHFDGPSLMPNPYRPIPFYPPNQPYQAYPPYNPYLTSGYIHIPFSNPFTLPTPSNDPRAASVDKLLKEAGIDNLTKLRMPAPDLRSLELLIVDLSREYPRLLPTFGDRFYVKNILRQYLRL